MATAAANDLERPMDRCLKPKPPPMPKWLKVTMSHGGLAGSAWSVLLGIHLYPGTGVASGNFSNANIK